MMRKLLIILFVLTIQATYAQHISYKHYTLEDGLPGLQLLSLHQAQDGRLWIGTKSGLSVFDGKHFVNYTEKDGLTNSRISSIQSVGDTLWFTTADGLMRFHNGNFQRYETPSSGIDSLQGKRIKSITNAFNKDELLLSMDWLNEKSELRGHSHFAFNTTTATFRHLPQFDDYFISSIDKDRLFLAPIFTDNPSSLYQMSTGTITPLTIKNFKIRPLNTWIRAIPHTGVAQGLIHRYDYRQEKFEFYRYTNDAAHPIELSVDVRPEDVSFSKFFLKNEKELLWVKPNSPFLFHYNLKTKILQQYNFPQMSVQCWLKDTIGNLWIGTENGLYKIPATPFYFFDMVHGLPENNIWSVQHLNDRWWVAAYADGLYQGKQSNNSTQFERYPIDKFPKNWGYSNHFYFGLRKTSTGKLMIPINAALYYDGEKINLVEGTYSGGKPYLNSYIDEDRREIAMVGLRGIDFIDFDGNLMQNIPTERFNGNVFDIERIDEENYMVVVGRGQSVYNRKTNTVTPIFVTDHTTGDTLNIGMMTTAVDSQGGVGVVQWWVKPVYTGGQAGNSTR